MAQGHRPDFGDAGYGQLGCPLMFVSGLVGVPVALFVAWWLEIDSTGSGTALWDGGYLLTVVVAALSGTLALTLAAEWVIERVPALWSRSDGVLLVVWLAVPAGLVVTVLLTDLGRALLSPLLLITVVIFVWMTVEFVRITVKLVKDR